MDEALIALDLGVKRTGIAIARDGQIHEQATIATDQLIPTLSQLKETEGSQKIIIGLPLREDGANSAQADWVRKQGQLIAQEIKLPIIYEDEILTTYEARRLLKETGLTEKEIAARIDQASAVLILKQYLNRES